MSKPTPTRKFQRYQSVKSGHNTADSKALSRQRSILTSEYAPNGAPRPATKTAPKSDVLAQSPPQERSSDRGKLLTAKTIRSEIFSSQVSEWWIRHNVAPAKKVRFGHSTVMWYALDVHDWIQERVALGANKPLSYSNLQEGI
ncbi:MAG: hypothetical protein ABI119_09555 [Gemmatimonadaceae bacterium]